MELLNGNSLEGLDSDRDIWLSINRHEIDLILGGLMKLLTGYGVRFDVDRLLRGEVTLAKELAEAEARLTLGRSLLTEFRVESLRQHRDFLLDRKAEVDSLGFNEDNTESLTELEKLTFDLWQL